MAIESGQQLLHYRLIEKIGEGGMGVVWKAQDTKLDREVALKMLPVEVASTRERRMRFEREAKALATLNHPNIVTVYSVEEASGIHFITMELVKGKTLSELIPRDGFSLERFFEIAIPLVDAVSTAHQQGVVHRDLKPANVIISATSQVKVLDFGLARLSHGPSSHGDSETVTWMKTEEGRLLGTVAYMSPEQAEGKQADPRSDIFSIGVVMYEMITGRRPFQGASGASIISSILRDTPPSVAEVKQGLPRHLGRIIGRCLAKNPVRRFQTTLDVSSELSDLRDEANSVDGESPREVARGDSKTTTARWGLAVAAVAIGILTIVFWPRSGDKTEGVPAVSFSQITSKSGPEMFPSVSPNADSIVYASSVSGNWDIYLRRIGGDISINLTPNSPADDTQPTFSPDGRSIAFRSDRTEGGVFVMGATGESVRRVSEFGYNPTWSPDGREVAFATEEITNFRSRYSHSELWIADVATGAMRRIDCGDAVQPAWSPDGDRIAYWGVRGGQRDLYTVAVTDGEPIAVTEDAFMDWSPAWSPDGGYLYFLSDRGGTMNLWRVRIDQASGRGASEPEPITVPTRQAAQLSISRATGHIAYVDTSETWNIQRVRFDAASEAVGEPEWLTRGDNVLSAPFPSPDGKWLSYFSSLPHDDIVVMRLDGSEVRQLTNDLAKDRCPSWSPDSDRIAFYSNRSGRTEVWTVQLDGRGLAQLTRTDEWVGSEGVFVYPLWSPDGARMSVYGVGCASAILELDDNEQAIEHRPLPRLPKTNDSFQPTSWASSGEKLAGHARLSSGAAMGVWIYSIREKSYMNLTDGGEFPRWLADDRRLIYRHDDRLLLVDSTTGAQRELLSFSSGSIGSRFQVSADNRWIYFTRSESESNIWLVEVH